MIATRPCLPVALFLLAVVLAPAAPARAFDAGVVLAERIAPAPPRDAGDDAPRVGTARLGIEAAVPVRLHGDDTIVVNGLMLERRRLEYPDATRPAGTAGLDELYALSWRFALVQRLGPRWRVIVYQQPGLWSDGERITSEHVRLEGGALFRRAAGAHALTVGAVYTATLGQPRLSPYAGYTYEGPRLYVDTVVPTDLEVLLRLGGGLRAGLVLHTTGAQYRIGRREAAADTLRTSVTTAGLGMRWRAAGPAELRAAVGRTLQQRFEPLRKGDDFGTERLENAAFARLGLALVF